MEQVVRRKTAIIACKAGYREPCLYYYVFWENLSTDDEKELVFTKDHPTSVNNSIRTTAFDAPLLEDLVAWVNEEFGRNPMGYNDVALEKSVVAILESEIEKRKNSIDGY